MPKKKIKVKAKPFIIRLRIHGNLTRGEPVATWRVNNATELGGEVCAEWQANHAYALGARCVCTLAYATTTRRAYVYECTTAGTSHATTQPTWPTSGTVNDGTVVWTTRQANDGDWNNASCILWYVGSYAKANGDTILIHKAHAEVTAINSYRIAFGSLTDPCYFYCVDKADDSLSSGAVVGIEPVSASEVYAPNFTGYGFSYGVCYKSDEYMIVGGGVDSHVVLSGPGVVIWLNNAAAARIIGAYSGNATVGLTILSGDIQFDYIGSYVRLTATSSFRFKWKGGSFISAVGCTLLLAGSTGNRIAVIEDVDLTQVGEGATATSLLSNTSTNIADAIIISRCKLPDDAGFTPVTGLREGSGGSGLKMHHCSAGNRYYDFYEESYEGECEDETTLVRTGGASDGTTGMAIKMVSVANVDEGFYGLESPPIHGWTDSNTEKTFTVEILHDSATALQNDEIWLELEYPANNTDGLGAVASSRMAPLGTPADTPDSDETWETGAMANPNTRKISVTVTPGKAGPITARVYLAKASTTVYVDAKITES